MKVSRRAGRPGGLLVSDHLAELGLPGIPAPYRSRSGAPYSDCHAGRLSVTPWIPGRAGAAGMTHEQWREFGGLLAQVHGARLPAELASHISREDYRTPATADLHEVDQWLMRLISGDVKADGAADPLCRHLAQSWTAARPGIRVVAELSRHPAADVLCHGDAHTFKPCSTRVDTSG